MDRSKQIQILLTERLYPDVRAVIQELKAWTGLTTTAQVTAYAVRDLRNRLARQRKKYGKESANG
jgi:hypothetical protein